MAKLSLFLFTLIAITLSFASLVRADRNDRIRLSMTVSPVLFSVIGKNGQIGAGTNTEENTTVSKSELPDGTVVYTISSSL